MIIVFFYISFISLIQIIIIKSRKRITHVLGQSRKKYIRGRMLIYDFIYLKHSFTIVGI